MFKLSLSELGIVLFIVLLVVGPGKLGSLGDAVGGLLYRWRAARRERGGTPPR
jgi:Sec-independent protein translocase protein TatA